VAGHLSLRRALRSLLTRCLVNQCPRSFGIRGFPQSCQHCAGATHWRWRRDFLRMWERPLKIVVTGPMHVGTGFDACGNGVRCMWGRGSMHVVTGSDACEDGVRCMWERGPMYVGQGSMHVGTGSDVCGSGVRCMWGTGPMYVEAGSEDCGNRVRR
jgi:hypothetical protein